MGLLPSAEPTQRRLAIASALAFFLIMTAYYLIRPVRDQFSGLVGAQGLPLYFGYTLLIMLLLTPLFGVLVSRVPRRALLWVTYGFFAFCLLLFAPFFSGGHVRAAAITGLVFFVWTSVFNLFVVSLFWSFMADLFSSEQARSSFPLIAFGGMGGALLGPWLSGHLVYWVGVGPLLAVSAGVLVLALLMLLRLDAGKMSDGLSPRPPQPSIGGSVWAGVAHTFSSPFLRNMTLLLLFGDAIGTLAYMLVADYSKAHYPVLADRLAFYAHLDLAINLGGAILQVTVTRWVLVRLGAGWGLMIPAMVNGLLLLLIAHLGTAPLWVAGASLAPVAILQVVTRAVTYGMTKPASDALYTRTSRENRYKGKNFIETAMWRVGDVGISSAVKQLTLWGVGMAGVALAGVGLSVLAVGVAWRAARARDLLPESRLAGSDSADSGSAPQL